MKKLILAAVAAVSAGAVQAQDVSCVRTTLSSDGFKYRSVAESWFPEELSFKIEGDRVRSDIYGPGTVERKDKRLYLTFLVNSASGSEVAVKMAIIEKNLRYTMGLGAKHGYADTNSARGKCTIR